MKAIIGGYLQSYAQWKCHLMVYLHQCSYHAMYSHNMVATLH